jgi:Protein of unknown function (DUF3619)
VIRAFDQAPLAHRQQALEARFGLKVARALNEGAVGHDIEQRLKVARQLALQRTAAARGLATAPANRVARAGSTAVFGGGGAWWLRLAAFAPLVVLALGLMLIEYVDDAERIRAAVEIDAVLLADTLPPKAYADPGFTEFLRQAPP